MRSVLNQRHIWVGCVLAVVLAVGILIGMAFTATTSEAAQAARSFTTPTGMILNYVKRGSTGDFEGVMAQLGEALQKSEAPNRRAQPEDGRSTERERPDRIIVCSMCGSLIPQSRVLITLYRRS